MIQQRLNHFTTFLLVLFFFILMMIFLTGDQVSCQQKSKSMKQHIPTKCTSSDCELNTLDEEMYIDDELIKSAVEMAANSSNFFDTAFSIFRNGMAKLFAKIYSLVSTLNSKVTFLFEVVSNLFNGIVKAGYSFFSSIYWFISGIPTGVQVCINLLKLPFVIIRDIIYLLRGFISSIYQHFVGFIVAVVDTFKSTSNFIVNCLTHVSSTVDLLSYPIRGIVIVTGSFLSRIYNLVKFLINVFVQLFQYLTLENTSKVSNKVSLKSNEIKETATMFSVTRDFTNGMFDWGMYLLSLPLIFGARVLELTSYFVSLVLNEMMCFINSIFARFNLVIKVISVLTGSISELYTSIVSFISRSLSEIITITGIGFTIIRNIIIGVGISTALVLLLQLASWLFVKNQQKAQIVEVVEVKETNVSPPPKVSNEKAKEKATELLNKIEKYLTKPQVCVFEEIIKYALDCMPLPEITFEVALQIIEQELGVDVNSILEHDKTSSKISNHVARKREDEIEIPDH